MTSQKTNDRVERVFQHAKQVSEGLIPKDSPPTFLRPEGDAAEDARGLPWWFGSDYHPTDEALADVGEPFPGNTHGPTTP